MKVLLDTNIIIHREASHVKNQDIGVLFKWLDRMHYEKLIHYRSVDEILKNKNQETVSAFKIKIQNYEILDTPSPMAAKVIEVSKKMDSTENDSIDTILLNEVFCNRIDLLITEDKKIHAKAAALDISDKIFNIDQFLEKLLSENPELVDYKVLNVQKIPFRKIDLSDSFFQSLKDDYKDFDKWFLRKYDDLAYITINNKNGKLLSFLYLKKEDENESYFDINPPLPPKKTIENWNL
jgi:predicted nucleic acid-binding protein